MYNHISVDFDGTLFVNGEIDKELVDKLNKQYNGKVFIFTSRSWGDYFLIKNLITEAKLKFEGIVCGKLIAGKYLDDRNISIDEFKDSSNKISNNNEEISRNYLICFTCHLAKTSPYDDGKFCAFIIDKHDWSELPPNCPRSRW